MTKTPLCDGCSSPVVELAYPCDDFSVMIGTVEHRLTGAWLVCASCATAIERGGDAFSERVLALMFTTRRPELGFRTAAEALDAANEYARLSAYVRELHRGFFEHRRGPARKWG